MADQSAKHEVTFCERYCSQNAANRVPIFNSIKIATSQFQQVPHRFKICLCEPIRQRRIGLAVTLDFDGGDKAVEIPITTREQLGNSDQMRNCCVRSFADI